MATSQNGWTVRLTGNEFKVATLPPIIGTVRAGDVHTVFSYIIREIDKRVEDLDKGRDDWGGNVRPIRGQSRGYSNHASWTAIDVNAMLHPRGKNNTFSSKDQAEIRKILRELDGAVRWGGDYNLKLAKRDDMHFEIDVDAKTLARVADKVRGKVTPVITPKPPIKPPGKPVWDGLTPEETLAVQKYLKRVTKDYTGAEDGDYGPMMVAAVKKYQKRQNQYGDFGLKVDGQWGPVMQAHYEWVKDLQDNVNDWQASKILGSLPEDGDYGHLSWRHVKNVQRVNGKRPNGAYYKAGGRIADGEPGPIFCKMLKISKHP